MYYVLSAFFFFGFCSIWAQPNIPTSSILPISSSEKIRTSWGNEEPKKLWSLNIGSGFSSVVDIGEKSFCQGYKEGKNTLFCVESTTGKILWTHEYPCALAAKNFRGGSRCTPSVYENVIYLPSHEGDLYALNVDSGKIIWSNNLVRNFGGVRPTWGFSGSPLLIEGKVILQTGSPQGSVVALDAKSGKLIWRAGARQAGYASPVLRVDSREIMIFNQYGLSMHDLDSGRETKSYQRKTRFGINAAQPLDLGDKVLLTSGYGKGSALVDVRGSQIRELWVLDSISCHISSPIQIGGYVYGIHGQIGTRSSYATLFCLDVNSARKIWEVRGLGLGSLVAVGDILVILTEGGELILGKSDGRKFAELANFQVLSGKDNWIQPTYYKGRMHCRSSAGEWVCLQMGVESQRSD